jgi:hypothetical protein
VTGAREVEVSAVVEPDELLAHTMSVTDAIVRTPRAVRMSTKPKALRRAGIDPTSPTLEL